MKDRRTTDPRLRAATFLGVESMDTGKKFSLFAALLLVGCVVFAGCHDRSSPKYTVLAAQVASDALTFAGSAACMTCHEAIYESWEKSRHTKKVRAAGLSTVVNDADNNATNDFVQGGAGATFDVGTSVPAGQTTWDSYGLGVGIEYPKLGWDGTNLVIRIGPNTYPVTYLLGGTGKWKQRYMVTIGNSEYISPVQYNDVTREYVPYHEKDWYTVSGTTLTGYLYGAGQTPVTQGLTRNSWQRRCVACHTTGLRDISVNASGEYGAGIATMLANTTGPRFSELPVACEACHGPSARHVELGGGVGTALNPDDLATDRGDEVCGSCHARGTSAHAEGFGYPWGAASLIDGGFRPGDILGDFYTDTGASSFWDDGATHSKKHHQQWMDHRDSPHAKAGVTCWACHDPHGSGIEGDLRMPAEQLCLSCHDGQGDIDSQDLAKHTRHQATEAQSCGNCHFNLVAKSAIKYDIRSHSYRVIYPAETESSSGIPNSCAACHTDKSVPELNSFLRARFPDVKPVAYASASASGFGVGFQLYGGKSFDPLGGYLTYEWTFKSGPPSFTADQLLANTGQDALFVPSQPGKHTFMLVVTNQNGVRSHPAEVEVDVTTGIDQNAPDLTQADYVKSQTCASCHRDTHSDWEVTRHTQKVRRPNEGHGMAFADTNNNLTNDWLEGPFNLATGPAGGQTTWDTLTYGSGITAPILDYVAGTDTYTVTIGGITYDVHWVLGGTGKWKQRYMTTIDEGDYILPIQYNEITNEWVSYHPENWYVINSGSYDAYLYGPNEGSNDTPVSLGRTNDSWQRRCTACHVTGARDMTQDAGTLEYGKSIGTMLAAISGPRIAETGAGCEACHGPGSIHEASPTLRGSIVNPGKLSALRSNEVCGACHNRGNSPNQPFNYPWGPNLVDGHFIPGMDLSGFYTPKDESGPKGEFWQDPYGHAKKHHQQWLDLRWTKHFVKGGMTCGTCHTGHNEDFIGQLKQEETALCSSCHPDIVTGRGPAENHSRHGDLTTKCSNCHSPLTAKSAVLPDVSAHSFEIVWPQASTASGIPNSCMTRGCHSTAIGALGAWDHTVAADNAAALASINQLWGDLRPHAEPRAIHPADGKAERMVTFTRPVTVTLDGTKSYDPNGGNIVTHAWSILSAPDGNIAKLSSRLVAKPTFTPTLAGTYTFSLVVRDAMQSSEPATVTITVN